ncbi:uncharacterized protein LOC132261900 [Phlebotomus argentipes]|uniref:uncharacterized protein LOC132261900 n=1 Tax=Phlebotomus argentipes TaxID=94469 RepID=UPI002892EF17|nr:uncharacterized protein LOC132261900 [Phlebotomus argentipes]
MKILGLIFILWIAVVCVEAAVGWPVSNPKVQMTQTMMEIPQWHCLRYFKHDIHLMRRCRNYRVPMFRKPIE